jgi:hypothetical protein
MAKLEDIQADIRGMMQMLTRHLSLVGDVGVRVCGCGITADRRATD